MSPPASCADSADGSPGSSSGRRAAAGALAATVVTAGLIGAGWAVIGPTGFTFAWVTHVLLMAWVSVLSGAWTRALEHPWFRVAAWERAVHEAVGVRAYGRVLDATGWNRVIERTRGFDGTRAGLPALDQHTRRSEGGHLLCVLIAVLLAGAAAGTGAWSGAGWLVGLGIVLHLYPALLQRLLRLRIQALRAR
ncbi:hypothetical protein [Kocuria sp. NPDC057446]|uniref:glycosyl-4,4'-diaponeurosporenoate acyltransferase CrtO family protein n=1 Tax=Kocuria sp. NPDC057446 TaxID=3346137 RepID=UPI00369EC984